jgi:hypothetical protein
MADYIEITSDATSVRLEYNLLAPASKFKRAYLKKTTIRAIALAANELHVEVETDNRNYQFSFDGANNIAQVSLVNSVAPTSNSDLYNLFILAM